MDTDNSQAHGDKELRILLISSQARLLDDDVRLLEGLLESGCDWRKLLGLSRRHKTFPRMWDTLRRHCQGAVPGEILERQKHILRRHFFTCAVMTKRLLVLVDLLNEHGIFHIPYKGAALAMALYGDISKRAYGDHDILIAESDFPAVYTILTANGYEPELELAAGQLRAYAALEDNLSFHDPQNVAMEIHWELSGRYLHKPMGLEHVRRRLTSVQVLGRRLPCFSPEDSVVYFCLHGIKHNWEQLDLINCLAETLEGAEGFDWDYVEKTADRFGCRKIVSTGLLLAQRLLAVDIPPAVAARIGADGGVVEAAARLESDFRDSASGRAVSDPRFSSFRLLLRDSRYDALRYIGRLVFYPTKAEWKFMRLPTPLLRLYWLMRPFRVAGALVGEAGRRRRL